MRKTGTIFVEEGTGVPPEGPSVRPSSGPADQANRGPVCVSFREAYAQAKEQLPADYFLARDRRLLEGIYRVMAEVYMLAPTVMLTVDGERLQAGQVQEIYRLIDTFEAQRVMDQFREVHTKVTSVKRFLRTLLYNVVIEANVAEENELCEW